MDCPALLATLVRDGDRGGLRDLRAGAHHGGYCLGCCWSLMAALIALGMMNVAAIADLAAVVLSGRSAAVARPTADSRGSPRSAGRWQRSGCPGSPPACTAWL
jgi:predicted metal-binding membrane protein